MVNLPLCLSTNPLELRGSVPRIVTPTPDGAQQLTLRSCRFNPGLCNLWVQPKYTCFSILC